MNNEIHIKVIRAKTPEEIAKLTEQESNKLIAFSSPIIQDNLTNLYVSFIYYRTLNQEEVKEEPKQKKEEFKPTPIQLERWKNTRITPKTYGLLLNKGFPKEDIKHMKNQYEAYIVLKNLQEENI